MPSRVACSVCGYVLAQWEELPPHYYAHRRPRHGTIRDNGVFWYVDLYKRLRGKCPGCGRLLLTPKQFREEAKIAVVIVEKALVAT
jgi:ribosomal protein S27E